MPEPTATPAPPGRPPALPSTADAVPYVPVAWLAVAAGGVAAAFALVLLVAGFGAYQEKRPLLLPQVLILPILGLVLSFAARRVVRNAEGTRTGALFGVDLVAAAWWTCLVAGLCYLAYLFAVDFSIRQDAKGEVERWAGAVLKDDLTQAFYRTRDPDQRRTIGRDDTAALEARYRTEFLAFRQVDLVRVAGRNPGRCEFVPSGLRDWTPSPIGVECTYAGTLRCPEGVFPVRIPLRGSESGVAGEVSAGRQWQVFHHPSGYIQRDQVKLTPYGWRVYDLERQGGAFAREFVSKNRDRGERLTAYLQFAQVDARTEPAFRELTVYGLLSRSLVVGVPTGAAVLALPAVNRWGPGPEIFLTSGKRLFRLPGDKEPSAEEVRVFAGSWAGFGVEQAGIRLKESPDVHDVMAVTDAAVEVRSPVEIALPPVRGEQAAARGRLVIRCTDPALLAELKALRESADPDQATASPPPGFDTRPLPWTLVRIESDLKRVPIKGPEGPGAPRNTGMEP